MAEQQKDPTSALPLSVPGSDPVGLKQLHTELTQRLQQFITQKKQGRTPLRPPATQGKLSGVLDLEGKSSADQRVSTLCAPKVQQAQRKGSVKETSKCRTAQEASVGPNKAAVKGPMTKALQKIPPSVKAETKRPPSSRDKVFQQRNVHFKVQNVYSDSHAFGCPISERSSGYRALDKGCC